MNFLMFLCVKLPYISGFLIWKTGAFIQFPASSHYKTPSLLWCLLSVGSDTESSLQRLFQRRKAMVKDKNGHPRCKHCDGKCGIGGLLPDPEKMSRM